jgi:two-component system phosphate regulon response regulator PhoB
VSKQTVLIVDDEEDIRDLLSLTLEKAGFSTLCSDNGRQGLVTALDRQPDLILLDWMMPEMNGLELLRRLKKDSRTADIPVIMLSAKTEVDHKSEGLDSGADDYVAKPFSGKELISRVNALLRRSSPSRGHSLLTAGKLIIDRDNHCVKIGDEPIRIGPTEFRLLYFFVQHPDRVYSRSQLLDQVWGNSVYIDERTVDVHIRRLRKALKQEQQDKMIQTVHGVGYRFSDKI